MVHTHFIKEENLGVEYLPLVNISDRDKELVEIYLTQGKKQTELAEQFNISSERVSQIISRFAKKAHIIKVRAEKKQSFNQKEN